MCNDHYERPPGGRGPASESRKGETRATRMNVTDDAFRRYIETLHATWADFVREHLPDGVPDRLLRSSLMKGRVEGYISTQFGAGFEYTQGTQALSLDKSSRRIEDLFTKAPLRVSKLPPMFKIGGSDVSIQGLTLEGTFPFRLTSEDASLVLIDVRFAAFGWMREVEYAEIYGNRRAEFWSKTRAVERALARAKDDVLLVLLDLQRAGSRGITWENWLGQWKERTVLVLGDYNEEGRRRLSAIKNGLLELGYDAVLLDEVPDNFHYNLQQKATIVGGGCRFVVIDDSSKSGHLVEFVRSQLERWITIVLRMEGSEGSFMTRGEEAYSKVAIERAYTPNNVEEVLQSAVDWAEKTIVDLHRASTNVYPWRRP